ncbi:hypothetical protein L218DRAFT_880972, partial [Marasmius fiardii PR-910]
VTVISATLLVSEIIMNSPAEIEHIWMGKWSFITVLYIIQRYLPIFDSVVVLFRSECVGVLASASCSLRVSINALHIQIAIHLFFFTVILTLRVWTVWKGGTRVTIGLLVLFFACWVPAYVFLAQFLSALEFIPFPSPGRGCFISGRTTVLYIFWLMMMVYEAGESFHPFST